MKDMPVSGPGEDTPLERRLRALLAEEGHAVPVRGTPHIEIMEEGRRVRRRRRAVLGAGLSVLIAVPAVALAAQGSYGSDTPSPAAAGEPSETTRPGSGTGGTPEAEPNEEPVPDQPLPPSDPERQLLDGITLEEARAQLRMCLDEYADDEGEGWLDDGLPKLDASDLKILLAWQGHGGENQGPGPIRRVLAVSVADVGHAELVCNQSMGETTAGTGMQSALGFEPPERPEVIGRDWDRYHTPEEGLDGDWGSELPFRWAYFNYVDEGAVARVTVEYGGETQEAIVDGGFFLTAGSVETPPDAHPVVLGYDEEGEVVYDSRESLPRS
jgi:hypothetical protein